MRQTLFCPHKSHLVYFYLKRIVQLNDPLVLGLRQNVLLRNDVRDLLPLNDLVLLQRLHRVQPAGLRTVDQRSNEADLAESSEADCLDFLEIFSVEFGSSHSQVIRFFPAKHHSHLLA